MQLFLDRVWVAATPPDLWAARSKFGPLTRSPRVSVELMARYNKPMLSNQAKRRPRKDLVMTRDLANSQTSYGLPIPGANVLFFSEV